jgi:hypothetical protein
MAGVIALGAAPVLAQGPVVDPLPANTCPSGKNLKLIWLANEVATDGGATNGPGFAETMIVCHSTEKTGGKNLDIFVELYDFGGTSASVASACGVSAGATAAFVTLPTIPPYLPVGAATAFVGGAVTPPGSVRIMATKPKIVCDVTIYDTFLFHSGVHPGPIWSKDVTLTKAKAPQKGD